MHRITYWQLVKSKWWQIILFVGGICAITIFVISLMPPEYSSQIQVMVIQSGETDSYVAAKSAERVAKNLASVIPTSSFLEKIAKTKYVNLQDLLNQEEGAKRAIWKKKVSATVKPETGIIKITAYDKNKAQAANLVSAVAYVLTTQSEEYHGGGSNIILTIIDNPLTSKYPARPAYLQIVLTAFLFSLLASLSYLFLKREFTFAKKARAADSPHYQDYHVLEAGQEKPKTIHDHLKDWVK